MKDLSSFLAKFRKLKNPREERILISGIVSKIVGVPLEDNLFLVKNGVLYIKAIGKVKSEIFIKKNQILKELSKTQIKLNIREII